jgi:prepilin-type N-terminal cleavage/methylation domain-containing protein
MKKVAGQSGFTITELLISVVIIAIGVVGFATAVGLASTELWMGRRDTDVSMLMSKQAEQLKSQPYDNVVDGSRTEGQFTLTWDVQGSNPKKLVLSATVPRKDGGAMAETVVFYVTR